MNTNIKNNSQRGKLRIWKLTLILSFFLSSFSSQAQSYPLRDFLMLFHFTNAQGGTEGNNNSFCCGQNTIYLKNKAVYGQAGTPVSNYLTKGYYKVEVEVLNGTNTQLAQIASIPAKNWFYDQVIAVPMNRCDIANMGTINFYVSYYSPSGEFTNKYSNSNTTGLYIAVYTPKVDAGPDLSVCQGQSVDLLATGTTTYKWSPPTYLSNPNVANPTCLPDATITYEVTGTKSYSIGGGESLSCSAKDNITVKVLPVAKLDLGPDRNLCSESEFPLQLSAPAGFSIYRWKKRDSSGQLQEVGSQQSYSVTSFGEYCVEVTTSDGCLAHDCILINNRGFEVNITPDDPFICSETDVTLTANISPTPVNSGPFNPIYKYLWSNGGTKQSTTVNTSGIHSVQVTNFFGCTRTDAVEATILEDPIAFLNYCLDGCIFSFSANTLIPAGYTASYLWDFGDGNTSNLANPFHLFQNHGVQLVTLSLTLSNGSNLCTFSKFVEVFNNCESSICNITTSIDVQKGLQTVDNGSSVTYFFSNNSVYSPAGGTATYQWQIYRLLNGGLKVLYKTGTSSSYLADLPLGRYEVCFTTSYTINGLTCLGSDCIKFQVNSNKSLNTDVNPIGIYPNPTSGKFTLSLPTGNNDEFELNVRIVDATGSVVHAAEGLIGARHDFDLTHLPQGMYFIHLQSSLGSQVEKLLIHRNIETVK